LPTPVDGIELAKAVQSSQSGIAKWKRAIQRSRWICSLNHCSHHILMASQLAKARTTADFDE
jgi:hypothetical protein